MRRGHKGACSYKIFHEVMEKWWLISLNIFSRGKNLLKKKSRGKMEIEINIKQWKLKKNSLISKGEQKVFFQINYIYFFLHRSRVYVYYINVQFSGLSPCLSDLKFLMGMTYFKNWLHNIAAPTFETIFLNFRSLCLDIWLFFFGGGGGAKWHQETWEKARFERCFPFKLLPLELSYIVKNPEITFYILEKGSLIVNHQECESI